MVHHSSENSQTNDPQKLSSEKEMEKRRLSYQWKRTLESALPFLLVWSVILLLMMGAAVLRHNTQVDHPAQSSQTSKTLTGVRI